jgi:hypothetical protein
MYVYVFAYKHLNIFIYTYIHRTFIVAGIKKELKLYYENLNKCCITNLGIFDQNSIKSGGEKRIFDVINDGNHEDELF